MNNDRFQQYIHKFNRRVTGSEISSVAGVDQNLYQFTEFYRDSRHAFGVRYQEEKPNRDWIWGVWIGLFSVFAIVLLGNM